ncbi:energy-coupling factor transporter ATP-binding protein EcfA2 [Saccharothrix tamanrassetensis]|uniref:Energy-coupling factor transporter ATP-binding protein EcfA2 n=1 Tax=Saccharothrix tamanrassetensis TaxID=1051531 RepID=A0A841CVC7_9PSEU|nr:helix-turn-helix domain-containing protein [Saccharothrix tamanrassetensis]MBB5959356.1 energy-coupling factor transporter ATP-binding protein EcfA2 [Saccharothrix tamanrassetensis]
MDVGDSPLLKFAADLRSLRDKAGGYSYRQLGARAHYSATTLSDAAGGRKLPSLAVTLAYVRACDGDVGEWEDRWHQVAAEVLPPPAPNPAEGHPPYAGLAPYGTEDAEWFFGRDRILEDLEARIADRRFVAVFGASGAGKSSLLRAGLVPRLPGPTVLTTPGELDVLPDKLDLGQDLIIVDQFEEVFTLCPDPDRRAEFVDALLTARCRVVLGVRADFYGHCAQYPKLVDALTDGQLLLGPMGPEELRQVIMQPAVKASCTVETALVSRLIADATGQAGVLPLMSHALLETWRRRRGTTLTLAGYEAAGGIQHAIAQTAERTFTSLEKHQRALARQVFLRLTALGDGTEDTKRRLPRAELDADVDVDVVLDRLAHARLLTLDRDTVEIAHEALIRSWPRLRNWLATDRDGLRTMRQLAEAATTWDSLGRDPDTLYRGTRLDTAVEWTQRDCVSPSAMEREFLADSLAARDRERRLAHRHTRRLRQLVALLMVLLILAVGAVVLAIGAQKQAAWERNLSAARYAVNEAENVRDDNPNLANQMLIAAYRLSGADDLRDRVLSAHAATSLDMVSLSVLPSGPALSPDGTQLPIGRVRDIADDRVNKRLGGILTPRNTVTSFVVTPSERAYATTAESPDARIWDVTNVRKPVVAHTFTGPVTRVAFAPNGGRLLVTVEGASELKLWDTTNPYEPVLLGVLTGHPRWIADIAFSPDGKVLATIDNQSTVRLWSLENPAKPRYTGELDDGEDVSTVALHSDGRTIAVAGAKGSIRLWDLSDRKAPVRLATVEGHSDKVRALGFSADGKALASAGMDDTVRMWDLADQRRPVQRARISGPTDGVYGIGFGDQRNLVTSNSDGTTRSWEFDVETAIASMCKHVDEPMSRDEWRRNFEGIDYRPPCG